MSIKQQAMNAIAEIAIALRLAEHRRDAHEPDATPESVKAIKFVLERTTDDLKTLLPGGFDEALQVDEISDFGWALEQLRAGKKVQRAGWNGRGQWLILIRAEDWSASVGPNMSTVPRAHRLPWIAMKTADDGLVPWLASQTDVLAHDWSVTEY